MILTAKTVVVTILRKLQVIIFCSETEQINYLKSYNFYLLIMIYDMFPFH